MRMIHRRRKSPFLRRRSRYAYFCARSTDSFAAFHSLERPPKYPLASFMTLFLRFRRATLLLTRGMGGSLRHQQPLEASFVGMGHQRRLPETALPLGMLSGEQVALVRVVAAQPAPPRQPDALAQGAFGFLFGHVEPLRYQHHYFGASTIDILRPSSFGSCSIFATSFSSCATRSRTSRPKSMWAICRPRYIIVTLTLLPSCRNSRAWRVLNSKSWSSMPGRYLTSFR